VCAFNAIRPFGVRLRPAGSKGDSAFGRMEPVQAPDSVASASASDDSQAVLTDEEVLFCAG